MDWKFPDVGEGLHEAQIVKWYLSEGDSVERDQPLVDVETDKAIVTIPSPVSGGIDKLLFQEGDTVKVGEVVISFRTSKEDTPKSSEAPRARSAPRAQAQEAPPLNVTRVAGGTVLATPAVRRLARERGIDIAVVSGSGPGGRVLAQDLSNEAAKPVEVHHGLVSLETTGSQSSQKILDAVDERRPLVGVRKRIAENMARSWAHAVQVSVFEEAEVEGLVKFRRELNERLGQEGRRLSYLPIIAKVAAALLGRFPDLNASLDEEAGEIVVHRAHHIGVAVDDPGGLMVPVVHDIDRLTLREVGDELTRLIEGARSHTLTVPDLTGSTFTITNYGTIGGVFATPIINYPEVGILGVGPIRRRPVVAQDDSIRAADTMTLSLTFDHRVVDGGYASRFLVSMVELLRDPTALVLEMR
ncbi:MAG: dihydrolipoamide acetyltransferase family protein [Ferrimicrobium sp.]